MADSVHELRITLEEIRPRVRRTFAVPSGISLAALHHVIQAVMGWEDSHLHNFEIGGSRYEFPMPDTEQEPEVRDSGSAILGVLAPQAGDSFTYTYDFGDNWVHRVEVLKVGPGEPGVTYPVCLNGERACPPEDCGGPFSFMELLDALAHPRRKENREVLDWLGPDYDPAAFDVSEVNAKLINIAKGRTPGPRASRRTRGTTSETR